MQLKLKPQALKGTVTVPPSKSLSHRAIIAASLAEGMSQIDNVAFSKDIETTISCMKNLGITLTKQENRVEISGKNDLSVPCTSLYCHESGSTLRFLIPIALLAKGKVTFTGHGQLANRPQSVYYDIFQKQGIHYKRENSDAHLPLTVEGTLRSGKFEVRGDVSSQFITGLLYTLPKLTGDSTIVITTPLESKAYVDLTCDVLKKFGVTIEACSEGYFVKGGQHYTPCDYRVEGDFSQIAFWAVAGILSGDVTCLDVSSDSLQGDKVIIDMIKAMGGTVEKVDNGYRFLKSHTRGRIIDLSQAPDLGPIVTVLAACSEGKTEIINASRLRIKESDRIHAMVVELSKLGADITENSEGMTIIGKKMLQGGVEVDSWNDHRVAMALAVASTRCVNPITLTGASSVTKSYPIFWEDFAKLGGIFHELNMGK